MGVRVPQNTLRANQTALRAFVRFTTSVPGFLEDAFQSEPHLRSDSMNKDGNGALKYGYNDWNESQLKRIRYHLIEFVVHYKNGKTMEDVKPSIMRGYHRHTKGLSRRLGYDLNLLQGPVFNCKNEGLMAVIDNKFSLQQAQGVFTESHNVLSHANPHADLEILYSSQLLSREPPNGFQARLIFNLTLLTAMPTALARREKPDVKGRR